MWQLQVKWTESELARVHTYAFPTREERDEFARSAHVWWYFEPEEDFGWRRGRAWKAGQGSADETVLTSQDSPPGAEKPGVPDPDDRW